MTPHLHALKLLAFVFTKEAADPNNQGLAHEQNALNKQTKGQGKEKDSEMEGIYFPYNPGDFKRSKYAMSLEDMSALVTELRKAASITSAQRQLSHGQHVGAPRVTAPPGPSIADIAKPRGKGFGTGIAGAFKGGIGGTAPVALK